MKLSLFWLFLLIVVGSCSKPTPSYQRVEWVDPKGQPLTEPFSKLSYGVTWRGLIWGSRLYYLGHHRESGLTAVYKVDPARGEGRIYKPVPKELASFSTLTLLPGPQDQVAWCYNTEAGGVVGGIFDPNGWVVEPKELLAPDPADPNSGETYPSLMGATWREGRARFLLFRGYPHRVADYKGLHEVQLGTDGKLESKLLKWSHLTTPERSVENLGLLGSHWEQNGWVHLFTEVQKDNQVTLWEWASEAGWTKVAENQNRHLQNPISFVDRTRYGMTDFSASHYGPEREDWLYTWTEPRSLKPFEFPNLPEGARPWNNLYRVTGPSTLEYVPCYYDGSRVFQKVGDRFLSLDAKGESSMLMQAGSPPRELFKGQSFPSGSDDYVFLQDEGKIWAVEFGGRYTEI